jgi:hypothetical protein
MSGLVRLGIVSRLEKFAGPLLKISKIFDPLGTDVSGFYMQFSGQGKGDTRKTLLFEIIARDGQGPYIPSMPAILMAKKLANGQVSQRGASACIGFISLQEYLGALKELNIEWLFSELSS